MKITVDDVFSPTVIPHLALEEVPLFQSKEHGRDQTGFAAAILETYCR